MRATPKQLAQFMLDNPHVIAAYNVRLIDIDYVEVLIPPAQTPEANLNTHALKGLELRQVLAAPIRPLITMPDANIRPESHTSCQDEPIQLGTQLQPHGAVWVGTAGLPTKWRDPDNSLHWGILSNWHVMVVPPGQLGHPQHQPTDRFPACARLAKWAEVSTPAPNTIDAALADALIDEYHTIAAEILEVGTPGDHPINATVGLPVIKSGRTTGLTHGHCTGIGAAVRVSYGDFTATFYDQDLFAGDNDPFSAAGDSGSAILGRDCRCPCSLLFAGNDQITVGNPVRFIVEAFDLQFPFS